MLSGRRIGPLLLYRSFDAAQPGMLRLTGCTVRLHLRVERIGRESTLFLKNFDVAVPCSKPHPRLSYEQPKPNSMACNQATIRLRHANWPRVVLIIGTSVPFMGTVQVSQRKSGERRCPVFDS